MMALLIILFLGGFIFPPIWIAFGVALIVAVLRPRTIVVQTFDPRTGRPVDPRSGKTVDGIGRFVDARYRRKPAIPAGGPRMSDDEYRKRLLEAGVHPNLLENLTSDALDNIGKTMRVFR